MEDTVEDAFWMILTKQSLKHTQRAKELHYNIVQEIINDKDTDIIVLDD